jgi:hypothetical protein
VIIAYLSLKGLFAHAIHEELRTTIGLDTVVYSTIIHYLDNAYCSPSITEAISIEVQKGLDDSDLAILSTFDKNSFTLM